MCGKTDGSERCGKVAAHKEIAKANAEDSCEMAKARGAMCEGKETVCKEIAKANGMPPENGRVQETTRWWLS